MTVTWEWLSSRACLGTFRLSMCTRQSQPAAVGVVTGFGQTLTCWQTAWLDSLRSFVLSQCSVWKNKKRKLPEGLTNGKEPMLTLALVQSQQQASHLSLVEAIIKQKFMGIFLWQVLNLWWGMLLYDMNAVVGKCFKIKVCDEKHSTKFASSWSHPNHSKNVLDEDICSDTLIVMCSLLYVYFCACVHADTGTVLENGEQKAHGAQKPGKTHLTPNPFTSAAS